MQLENKEKKAKTFQKERMACFVIESNTILSWNCSLVNFGKEINFISNVTIV